MILVFDRHTGDVANCFEDVNVFVALTIRLEGPNYVVFSEFRIKRGMILVLQNKVYFKSLKRTKKNIQAIDVVLKFIEPKELPGTLRLVPFF